MVQENMGLAHAIAKRFRLGDFEMVESIGTDALFRAAKRWDAERGVKFSTYACASLWHAYANELRATDRHRQIPDWVIEAWTRPKESARETPDVTRYLEAVDGRTAAIIIMRFWKGMTLEQIGKEFGMCKERVRQIEKQALEKMRAIA